MPTPSLLRTSTQFCSGISLSISHFSQVASGQEPQEPSVHWLQLSDVISPSSFSVQLHCSNFAGTLSTCWLSSFCQASSAYSASTGAEGCHICPRVFELVFSLAP